MATAPSNRPAQRRNASEDTPDSGDEGGMPPARAALEEDRFGTLAQSAHEQIDRLADSAAPHLQRLQNGVQAAGDSLRQTAAQALETGEEWTESLRCTVRERPLTAIAAATLLGLLIGRLSR